MLTKSRHTGDQSPLTSNSFKYWILLRFTIVHVLCRSVPMEKHALVIPEFEDEQNNGSDDESTVQSSIHPSHKSSVWNMFSRKSKLTESQSIPSIPDSENMVETGVHPLWRGSGTSMDSERHSGHSETTLTTGYGTDRSSQGIRG